MYALDYPPDREKFLARQVYRDSGKLPEAIQNAPRILPGLQLYYSAFFDLDRERATGYNGKDPIKIRDVWEYADYNEFSLEQAETLAQIIPKLDSAFLNKLRAMRAAAKQ